MSRARVAFRCDDCGQAQPRWMGRCPACGGWGTMAERPVGPAGAGPPQALAGPGTLARPIGEVDGEAQRRAGTGIPELDRVLGGGLVPGSVTLVGGEPGAGKSTLLLQLAQALSCRGRTVLYASAEEAPGQVRLRAERLGTLGQKLLLAGEAELPGVLALVEAHHPDVLVVDSIQAVRLPDVGGSAGAPGQVRACAAALVGVAKARGMACVLVGHVTKDGQLAGPRALEHLVDTVCELDGDRHHALRLLRAVKNRYGPVGEVGCFEMTASGLAAVVDAGRLFLGAAADGTPGVAATVALEGRRPLACEVQALVAPSTLTNPRRVASGLDCGRLDLLVAVLERRARLRLRDRDVYASSVGGLRLVEPAVDLALCLALASSRRDVAVSRRLVALAEVGLAGELRLVAQTERRLAEAARLGFQGALLPHAYDGDDSGLHLYRARDLSEALAAGLAG